MTRKPVSMALDASSMEDQIYVVCDDGSVWVRYCEVAEACWKELPPIPGSPAAERALEEA